MRTSIYICVKRYQRIMFPFFVHILFLFNKHSNNCESGKCGRIFPFGNWFFFVFFEVFLLFSTNSEKTFYCVYKMSNCTCSLFYTLRVFKSYKSHVIHVPNLSDSSKNIRIFFAFLNEFFF